MCRWGHHKTPGFGSWKRSQTLLKFSICWDFDENSTFKTQNNEQPWKGTRHKLRLLSHFQQPSFSIPASLILGPQLCWIGIPGTCWGLQKIPMRENHSHYFCFWRLRQSYWERVTGWQKMMAGGVISFFLGLNPPSGSKSFLLVLYPPSCACFWLISGHKNCLGCTTLEKKRLWRSSQIFISVLYLLWARGWEF